MGGVSGVENRKVGEGRLEAKEETGGGVLKGVLTLKRASNRYGNRSEGDRGEDGHTFSHLIYLENRKSTEKKSKKKK